MRRWPCAPDTRWPAVHCFDVSHHHQVQNHCWQVRLRRVFLPNFPRWTDCSAERRPRNHRRTWTTASPGWVCLFRAILASSWVFEVRFREWFTIIFFFFVLRIRSQGLCFEIDCVDWRLSVWCFFRRGFEKDGKLVAVAWMTNDDCSPIGIDLPGLATVILWVYYGWERKYCCDSHLHSSCVFEENFIVLLPTDNSK